MGASSWSQEQTLLFIELLRSEPIIWDPNEKYHKDRSKIGAAWQNINNVFPVPVEELKKKKESLLQTYRGYHRKVKQSMQSGSGTDYVYRPVWFAYQALDNFLGSIYKCKLPIQPEQNSSTVIEENDEIENNENNEDESNETSENVESMSPHKKTLRRRLKPSELQNASRQITEAVNTLNQILNRNPIEEEDEFDIFGRMIAKKLRMLPYNDSEDVMYEIHSLFRQRSYSIPRPFSTFSSDSKPG